MLRDVGAERVQNINEQLRALQPEIFLHITGALRPAIREFMLRVYLMA
jgi:hypothetical protein